MAVVPSRVTAEHIQAVEYHLSDEDIEWIVLAVSLGGFLNKFMDAMGIQLEDETVASVQALLRPTGWDPSRHLWTSEDVSGQHPEEGRPLSSVDAGWTEVDRSDEIPVDSIATYLRVFRQAPGAVRLEKAWTRGVSGRIGPVLLMLEEEVGYAFPILAALTSHKAVKSLATALRDNLDAELSVVGLQVKLLAGMVYAGSVGNDLLSDELAMVLNTVVPGIDPRLLAATRRFAGAPSVSADVPEGLSTKEAAAVLLAKAASSSPAEVSEITIAMVSPTLDPDEIVEVVVWLSLLQTLARLYSFFEAKYPAIDELTGEANQPGRREPVATRSTTPAPALPEDRVARSQANPARPTSSAAGRETIQRPQHPSRQASHNSTVVLQQRTAH